MNEKRRLAGTPPRPNRLVEIVLLGADFDGATIVTQVATDNTCDLESVPAIRLGILPRLVARMNAKGVRPAEILMRKTGCNTARFRCADDPPNKHPGWISIAWAGPVTAAFGHYARGIHGHWRMPTSHRELVAEPLRSFARRKV